MTTLFLASTKRYFGFGDKDDHVVLDGGRVIGRIFLSPQAPAARNWMWTITVMDYPRTIHSRGYSATPIARPAKTKLTKAPLSRTF